MIHPDRTHMVHVGPQLHCNSSNPQHTCCCCGRHACISSHAGTAERLAAGLPAGLAVWSELALRRLTLPSAAASAGCSVCLLLATCAMLRLSWS